MILKVILLLSVIVLLSYFTVKYILVLTHELFIDTSVKYPLSDTDKNYIKKKSVAFDTSKHGVFYTLVPWNTTNHFNYLLYNKKYYIIEPGYYYLFNENVELFLKDTNVIFMEIDFKKNKSKT